MKENLKIINFMDMEHYFIKMGIGTKDLSKMVNLMAMVFIYLILILNIEDSLKMDSIMGWAVLNGEKNVII